MATFILLILVSLGMLLVITHRLKSFTNFHLHLSRIRSQNYKNCNTYLKLAKSSIDKPLGSMTLVGAGPGNPDLLTLQAIKILKNADLVISDRLVSPELLALIDCELLIAKKKPGCAEEAQEEIYEWSKNAVLSGKKVVRLKIGDPFLFGRAGEEIIEFRKLGIEPTIVPGISSSYAAPLVANIPLTHRGVSSQVLISTGYGKDGKRIEIPEYHNDRTIVLLMAVGRLEEIVLGMVEVGYPIQTPVAIIENATNTNQRIIKGTLDTIVKISAAENVKPPATIIIGYVVSVLDNTI